MPALKPRANVASLPRYKPKMAAQTDGRIIRLSANEGALGPSPKALVAIAKASAAAFRYPTDESLALAVALGRRHGIDPDCVIFGCGSDELIGALCTAYLDPGDEAIHTEYGFAMYPLCTRAVGGVPVSAPDDNFVVDVDAILERVTPRTRIVFLANPNNPTGTYLPHDEVRRLHAGLPDRVLLVLDAAYAEYVARNDYTSGLELAASADNVIMLRTFSKLYALAGLRLGWGYGPAPVIEAMHAVKQPFGASIVAIAAGLAALEDEAFAAASLAHNEVWLAWTRQRLEALGLSCLPSVTNFLMVRFPDEPARNAAACCAYLAARAIFVRDMAPYNAPAYMRLSIGTEAEMRETVDAIGSFLDGKA